MLNFNIAIAQSKKLGIHIYMTVSTVYIMNYLRAT